MHQACDVAGDRVLLPAEPGVEKDADLCGIVSGMTAPEVLAHQVDSCINEDGRGSGVMLVFFDVSHIYLVAG